MTTQRTFYPEGDLDLATVRELRDAWCQVAEQEAPDRIVIDLSAVTFLDSTALGALIRVLKCQRAHGGDVVVRGAVPHVARVFAVTNLTAAFKVNQSDDPAGPHARKVGGVPTQNSR